MKLLYIGHYKENSGWARAAGGVNKGIQKTKIKGVFLEKKIVDILKKI